MVWLWSGFGGSALDNLIHSLDNLIHTRGDVLLLNLLKHRGKNIRHLSVQVLQPPLPDSVVFCAVLGGGTQRTRSTPCIFESPGTYTYHEKKGHARETHSAMALEVLQPALPEPGAPARQHRGAGGAEAPEAPAKAGDEDSGDEAADETRGAPPSPATRCQRV